MSFVHLHVHSVYSLLDGYSKLPKLVQRAKEMGMPAVALTDHGTMFGTIEFYNTALKAGIKPIIGVEGYMAPRGMRDKTAQFDKKSSHLLLLAQNRTGYQNLLKISSAAQLEGFYYRPRIDHEFLAAHAEGLICTTGCLGAEIPQALMKGNLEEAKKKFDFYYDVFGKDNFFVELQHHEIPELLAVNKQIIELNKRYNMQYVATNDVHYVDPEDAKLQDVLLAIQTGSLLKDEKRMRMEGQDYYLRSPDEMKRLFGHIPGAIENTLLIAERCELDLSRKGYHLPLFDVPEGYTAKTYLRELCEEGLRWRYGEDAASETIQTRLDYELGIIHEMGFDAYFLIVWDLCRHAAEQGIWYTARGSAAGSIVAYSLRITTVDPILHGLIFERFLNPGRISMPDIDLDFPDDRRAEMMGYCADRYGHDKVAQIITFGTLKARAAVRDVGRVMDIPLSEVDRVAKLIPAVPGKNVPIEQALEDVPDLRKLYKENGHIRELLDTAKEMEGVIRNAGTHAAGVVVTDKPVIDYAPLHRPTSKGEDLPIKSVTQFEMNIVDAMGLLKVDFLGLVTLTVMARACGFIKERYDKDYALHSIPVDNPASFELLGRGNTAGVFQVEGQGMRRNLVEMKPKNLDNVVAMIALYRPGPLEFIPSYIRRMHGEEPVSYLHPVLEPIFKDTFGIAVYQEQIMRAAVDIAGYTNSEADGLRKAISKKKQKQLIEHRSKFVSGASESGTMPAEIADRVFENWLEFARYGFNKSHAVAYGVISVQTAYLKAHYPVEFMTANLSAYKANTDRVALYVADCRQMGIEVLPPDVNSSGWDFTIEDKPEATGCIRFGMGAVKNVGYGPAETIMHARKGEPFADLDDFAQRVDLRSVGKRALESLIKVGALDQFGPRTALLTGLEHIVGISAAHFKAADAGQMSLFGKQSFVSKIKLPPPTDEIPKRELLKWERDLIGLYITDHPLSPYMERLNDPLANIYFSGQLGDLHDGTKVRVAGLLTRFRTHVTKKGKNMGFATLQDLQGNIELVIFPRTWEKVRELIEIDKVLFIEGSLDDSGKLLVDSVNTELKYSASAEGPPPRRSKNGGGADRNAPRQPRPAPPAPSPALGAPAPSRQRQQPPAQPKATVAPRKRIAEPPKAYAVPLADSPPPPDAFPDDWDSLPPPDDLDDAEMIVPKDVAVAPPAEQPAPAQAQTAAQPAPAAQPANPAEQSAPAAAVPRPTPAPIPPPAILLRETAEEDQEAPRRLIIVQRSNGDQFRDALKIKRVYNLLISYPGHDRFALYVFEGGRSYLLEFPNFTTGICDELLTRLAEVVGQENLQVEPIIYQ